MPNAPSEIMDALESILDIFLSDIRHRERAAFILCDNLVEMACKMKHTQHCRRSGNQPNTRCQFHQALQLAGCRLSQEFRGTLQQRRDTRNLMQHQSASAVVDVQTCADAILDLPEVLSKLWGRNALDNLREWQKIAIRVARLYSSSGDANTRFQFEDAMRREPWRGIAEERNPRTNETIIECGLRIHWAIAVKQSPPQVEQILNSFGAT
jgi:hypothetical protein